LAPDFRRPAQPVPAAVPVVLRADPASVTFLVE
jgi:hypothetical protein